MLDKNGVLRMGKKTVEVDLEADKTRPDVVLRKVGGSRINWQGWGWYQWTLNRGGFWRKVWEINHNDSNDIVYLVFEDTTP